jgi:hypothetical protein
MDDFVISKFTGESVDILCKMNPSHTKQVVLEGGTKVLYVRLVKAYYGCVKLICVLSAILNARHKRISLTVNPLLVRRQTWLVSC